MGRSITCNYEAQSERVNGSLFVQGAMSLKSAIEELLLTCKHYALTRGYIWGQTWRGKNCIRNKYKADYICIDNIRFEENTNHYTIKPMNVIAVSPVTSARQVPSAK